MAGPSHTRGKNLLLYAASDLDADMLYATRFFAPDPFIFVRTARGRRILVMSDLEIDRARSQSTAHRVLSFSRLADQARRRLRRTPHAADVMVEALRELRIRSVLVPERFPAGVVRRLRRSRIGVRIAPQPLFPERAVKSETEVREIRRVMRITERGMAAGVALLEQSRVRGGYLFWKGRRLTAETIRTAINTTIFAEGCIPARTIVAPGRHGCDPHDEGAGPVRAGQPVIIDIFPRAESTGYFGDITRTFVKGAAPEPVMRMYRAVLDAQRMALRSIRPGVNGRDVHESIQGLFGTRGFETGKIDGRMQGFFHGTGHGVGLDIHESPRIGPVDDVLRRGMVVTVEPGLYYWPVGGVRIEDTVLVTGDGIRNLTRFPKYLEID
jgi:Xaa-Pro aminopeptidase